MSRRMDCRWTSACNAPIATREAAAKARLFGARKAATNVKPSEANLECIHPSGRRTDTDIARVDPNARYLDAKLMCIDANDACIDAACVCFDVIFIYSAASSHCLSESIVCMDTSFIRLAARTRWIEPGKAMLDSKRGGTAMAKSNTRRAD